eukprot:gene8692-6113_t
MLEFDAETLTYELFRQACLVPNRPAIIRRAAATQPSPAAAPAPPVRGGAPPSARPPPVATRDGRWAWFDLERATEALSPCGLASCLGLDFAVPAYRCTSHAPGEGVSLYAECEENSLRNIIAAWGSSGPERYTYLKDFHFQHALETKTSTCCEMDRCYGSPGLYVVPPYLGADYLNAFCLRNETPAGFGDGSGDYRFAYIGPPGSQTPLHFDVFGSYSWSLNVCGVKRWFFPTEAGNALLHQCSVPGFPLPPDVRATAVELLEVVQEPGDLVFVPARYLHQVQNVSGRVFRLPTEGGGEVELTISINHNWCNAFNVSTVVDLFLQDARYLQAHVSRDDLALLHGLPDVASLPDAEGCAALLDTMMQRSCNWSFQSITAFIRFCVAAAPQDDDQPEQLAELLTILTGARQRFAPPRTPNNISLPLSLSIQFQLLPGQSATPALNLIQETPSDSAWPSFPSSSFLWPSLFCVPSSIRLDATTITTVEKICE